MHNQTAKQKNQKLSFHLVTTQQLPNTTKPQWAEIDIYVF